MQVGTAGKLIYPFYISILCILPLNHLTRALHMSFPGRLASSNACTNACLSYSAFFLTLATFISAWGKAYKYFSLRVVYVLAILVFETHQSNDNWLNIGWHNKSRNCVAAVGNTRGADTLDSTAND